MRKHKIVTAPTVILLVLSPSSKIENHESHPAFPCPLKISLRKHKNERPPQLLYFCSSPEVNILRLKSTYY
jgi:hypothetical protein